MTKTAATTKSVRMQRKWAPERRPVHGVPVDITSGKLGTIFARYGQLEDVSATISKVEIATGDFVFQVTLTHKSFAEISSVVMRRKKYARSGGGLLCSASGRISKACTTKT